MNTALWIAQGLLATVFLLSGYAKSTYSKQQFIKTKQTGVINLPMPQVRFIGITELLAAIGLIVPWFTGILPVLTPIAAFGLGLIMVLAAWVHYKLQEPKNVRNNFILLAICFFVGIGRLLM